MSRLNAPTINYKPSWTPGGQIGSNSLPPSGCRRRSVFRSPRQGDQPHEAGAEEPGAAGDLHRRRAAGLWKARAFGGVAAKRGTGTARPAITISPIGGALAYEAGNSDSRRSPKIRSSLADGVTAALGAYGLDRHKTEMPAPQGFPLCRLDLPAHRSAMRPIGSWPARNRLRRRCAPWHDHLHSHRKVGAHGR